jgi:hypothetical protein
MSDQRIDDDVACRFPLAVTIMGIIHTGKLLD